MTRPPAPADATSAADEPVPWREMVLQEPGRPLQPVLRDQLPQPGPGQVRIRVAACGVCRTDLHLIDGELAFPGGGRLPLDAALIFAPIGALVPAALRAVRPGGTVVCAGIHMADIPGFPYAWLWGERRLVSVANLTRRDGEDFLRVAAELPLKMHVHGYALAEANQALADLRAGRFDGAAVLRC